MQYFAGLVVFSGIGSFLISDTIDFGKELRKSSSSRQLYLDFFRLIVLGAMALVGYMVAKETFHQPNDWIFFLVIGLIGAFLIYIVGVKRISDTRGIRRP